MSTPPPIPDLLDEVLWTLRYLVELAEKNTNYYDQLNARAAIDKWRARDAQEAASQEAIRRAIGGDK